MQQFILQGNIGRFEEQLKSVEDDAARNTLNFLLTDARRQLSLLESARFGSHSKLPRAHGGPAGVRAAAAPDETHQTFRATFADSVHPYLIIDPGPGLLIVDANPAYCAATMTARGDIVGKPLFEVFPDNPDDGAADGVTNLFRSICIVGQTLRPHAMAVQRYDIRDGGGNFVERHWQPVNSPLFDEQGALKFILHHVEDVTEEATRAKST